VSEPLTEDEVMRRMLQVFPDAELGQDNEGQLVVYTGLYPAGFVTTTERTYAPEPVLKIIELDPRGFKGDEEC